jgi:hypothetical protein
VVASCQIIGSRDGNHRGTTRARASARVMKLEDLHASRPVSPEVELGRDLPPNLNVVSSVSSRANARSGSRFALSAVVPGAHHDEQEIAVDDGKHPGGRKPHMVVDPIGKSATARKKNASVPADLMSP